MPKRFVAAVITAVCVLAGGTVAAQATARFADVPADHPQADAIEWAAESGLTAGYEDGTFRPDEPLPRWAALIFMERFYDDVLGAAEADGFTRGDMMALLKAINDAAVPSAAPEPAVEPDVSTHCDALRRTPAYTYPGQPTKRLEVGVVSVGFDPPGFFNDLDVPDINVDDLLAAVETQLEELSHGRTDVVFHRLGDVTLSDSPHAYAGHVDSLQRTARTGIVPRVRGTYPDTVNLLALTTSTFEYPTTSFYLDRTAVAAVEGPRSDPDDPVDHAVRFSWARSQATHELLHLLGLDDLYAIGHRDPSTAGGEWSLMGMRAYGYGQGTTRTSGALHEPVTGWNKWLLGWLDDTEVVCVSSTETATVVLRPHQQVSSTAVQPYTAYYPAGTPGADCWEIGPPHATGPYWGPAAPDPVIAVVATSSTTALVVEADPFAAQGVTGAVACGGQGSTTRTPGDVIVYAVDVTVGTGKRPQRMINPTVALVTPTAYKTLQRVHGPEGIGRWYEDGTPGLDTYYATELVVDGYRIAVQDRRIATDGQPEITVTIEPTS